MRGLPTINPDNYDDQLFNNNEKMQKMLNQLFPELHVPYDAVFQILSYLADTKINALILPHVIRGIYNLQLGTGKGQVIVHVRSGVSNVQVQEQNDPLSVFRDNLESNK